MSDKHYQDMSKNDVPLNEIANVLKSYGVDYTIDNLLESIGDKLKELTHSSHWTEDMTYYSSNVDREDYYAFGSTPKESLGRLYIHLKRNNLL